MSKLQNLALRASFVGGGALLPVLAMAQTAQPDVTEVADYLTAGVATLGTIAAAALIVKAALSLWKKMGSAAR